MARFGRSFVLASALCAGAAGCSGGGGGGSAVSSIAAATSGSTVTTPSMSTPASTSSSSSSSGASSPSAPKPPHVALLPRGIAIDGKPRLLLGAEVQYFRIRDPGFDGPRTWQMWEETLDRFKAASLNFVTAYVPWDYHEEVEAKLDFTGARDLDRFLEMCWKRDLVVQLKPGPLINAEWPNGLGSFGGAPPWFKTKHPDALARSPSGQPFTVDLIGRAQGRLPSYFAPAWRDATRQWFAALAPIVKKYVIDRPTIAMIQLDNETNFYFRSRFSSDYSSHGVNQYRAWLAKKYATIAQLNAAYGTSYATFADVKPPSSAPSRPEENLPAQDWFDAGKDGIAEYHGALRAMWEGLGLKEPDVLFTTNDSPHAMPLMDLQLWDGPSKNTAGLSFLDAYPKQSPLSGQKPLDYPFLTGFFAKRFAEANALYRFQGGAPVVKGACFAAEIQGGIFELPIIGGFFKIPVPDATTDHILLDFVGHGGVGGSTYIFRGGINRDGSSYDFQAALATDGTVRGRYDVLRRHGRLATVHGAALLASDEVVASVALVLDSRLDAPAADVAGSPAWIQTKEACAAFGWLEDAGLNPEVIDARHLNKGDLDRFKCVFFLNPDAVHDSVAETLDDYVRRGGALANLLHEGARDGLWRRNTVASRLLQNGLFSDGRLLGVFENTLIADAHVNLYVPGASASWLTCGPFLGKWTTSANADVIARDRTFPFGWDGDVVAWRARRGRGQVVFLATNPAQAFADAGYYDAASSTIDAGRDLARWIAAQGGASPILEVQGGAARAFARRVDPSAGGGAFVFIASRASQPSSVTVSARDLAALGLVATTTYSLEEATSGASLGKLTGADVARGLTIALGPYGTAVVRIR